MLPMQKDEWPIIVMQVAEYFALNYKRPLAKMAIQYIGTIMRWRCRGGREGKGRKHNFGKFLGCP